LGTRPTVRIATVLPLIVQKRNAAPFIVTWRRTY
jgi:hypothetical protein